MATTPKTPRPTEEDLAVRRVLLALDKCIAAAEKAAQAREELVRIATAKQEDAGDAR